MSSKKVTTKNPHKRFIYHFNLTNIRMESQSIVKRDGTLKEFDSERIKSAIRRAFIATETDISENELEKIVGDVLVRVNNTDKHL